MIFREELAALVDAHKKTQTRRLVKVGQGPVARGPNILFVLFADVTGAPVVKYGVGKTYAVQPGRGKKALCRIKLLSIKIEQVRDISEWDAREEGFAGREEFFSTWRELYGEKADLEAKVWVLEFERVKECESDENNKVAVRTPNRVVLEGAQL